MSKVFVLGTDKQPLTPVHPAGARYLLKEGKAAVYRRYPFTIILRAKVEKPAPTPLRLKIDPGAKTTGLAITNDVTGEVIWAAQLTHRGAAIKSALDKRRGVRRGRRQRRTRYRAPRFRNRRRRTGWLPPSLRSRVENILTWVRRISRFCPITALSQELVRFDLQKMANPEIAGVAYQQGTLFGYEVREYLLAKWQRTCAYCGAQEAPLQVEHILSRAKGGSDRLDNLGRHSGQRDPLGTVQAAQRERVAPGDRIRRAHEVQSGTTKPAENPLVGRCLCWALDACETANSPCVPSVDRGDRTRPSSHVQHQRTRVPSELSAAAQTLLWLSDRRPGAGCRPSAACLSGHTCWASRRAGQGNLHDQHETRQNHGCASPLLPAHRTHERL